MYFLKLFSVCLKHLSIRPQERTSPPQEIWSVSDIRHSGNVTAPSLLQCFMIFLFQERTTHILTSIFLFPLTTSFLKPNLSIAFFAGTSQTNPWCLWGEKLHLGPAGPGQPSSTLNKMKEIKAAGTDQSVRQLLFNSPCHWSKNWSSRILFSV